MGISSKKKENSMDEVILYTKPLFQTALISDRLVSRLSGMSCLYDGHFGLEKYMLKQAYIVYFSRKFVFRHTFGSHNIS